jgi:hypothetical protein
VGSGRLLPHIQAIDSLLLHSIPDPMTDKEIDYSGEEKNVTLDEDLDYSPEWESQDAKAIRQKQIEEGNRAENIRLRNLFIDREVEKVSQDATSLLGLYDKDPKLAKEVAKKIDREASEWKDFDSFLNWVKKSSAEDDFETRYQKKRAEERHQEAIKKVEKQFSKLPEELREKAQAYFDKITKGKQLDEDDAMEFAEMTTLYVNKDKIKEWSYSDAMAELSSNWISKSKKPSKDESNWIVRDGELVNLSSNKQS